MLYTNKKPHFLVKVGYSVYYLGRWWRVTDSPKQGVWTLERKRRHNIGLPHRVTIPTSAVADVRFEGVYCPVLVKHLQDDKRLSKPEPIAFRNYMRQLNKCRKQLKVVRRLLHRAQQGLERYEAVCLGDVLSKQKEQ